MEPASAAPLRAAIVGLRCALPRLPPSKLLPAVQAGLLPRLFAAYDSPAADVRKATVDCLAAIWAVSRLFSSYSGTPNFPGAIKKS